MRLQGEINCHHMKVNIAEVFDNSLLLCLSLFRSLVYPDALPLYVDSHFN